MNNLTTNQKAVLNHIKSTGYFATDYDANCENFKDAEILNDLGFLVRFNAPSWMGDDFVYRLKKGGNR